MPRSRLLAPVVVLALTLGAVVGVWALVQRAASGSKAQLQIASLRLSVADLGIAPFNADPLSGGSPTRSAARIKADEGSISRGLTIRSQAGVPLGLLRAGRARLAALEPVVAGISAIAAGKGGLAGAGTRVPMLQGILVARSDLLSDVLDRISSADSERAARAEGQVKLGSAAAMLLLLAAFAFFYFRSVAAGYAVERLVSEKEVLLGVSRTEARTDALTELGNRRALASDLASAIADLPASQELLLSVFDLDGFKLYNDSFGHAAGDALLRRLGRRLLTATEGSGSVYRMGGDEFCVLSRSGRDAERLLHDAITALQDSGDGWNIGCSHGGVWVPSEAASASEALKLADDRMYANKTSRSPASRQVTDALLQVITEQSVDLDEHVERVSVLAGDVAEALGQPEHEVRRIRVAAQLHDIGKTAIPAAILEKPGPLDEREWVFIRNHPLIGERIVLAAPALANAAPLIRSSHERVDGHGYPDGLADRDIPIGSRIIAVCDAFDAMTSQRPYRTAPVSVDVALEELERNAGTQFDGAVVEAFRSVVRSRTGAPPGGHLPGRSS